MSQSKLEPSFNRKKQMNHLPPSNNNERTLHRIVAILAFALSALIWFLIILGADNA
jgi:hypothetical protein